MLRKLLPILSAFLLLKCVAGAKETSQNSTPQQKSETSANRWDELLSGVFDHGQQNAHSAPIDDDIPMGKYYYHIHPVGAPYRQYKQLGDWALPRQRTRRSLTESYSRGTEQNVRIPVAHAQFKSTPIWNEFSDSEAQTGSHHRRPVLFPAGFSAGFSPEVYSALAANGVGEQQSGSGSERSFGYFDDKLVSSPELSANMEWMLDRRPFVEQSPTDQQRHKQWINPQEYQDVSHRAMKKRTSFLSGNLLDRLQMLTSENRRRAEEQQQMGRLAEILERFGRFSRRKPN